jgi:hypothetical protein
MTPLHLGPRKIFCKEPVIWLLFFLSKVSNVVAKGHQKTGEKRDLLLIVEASVQE